MIFIDQGGNITPPPPASITLVLNSLFSVSFISKIYILYLAGLQYIKTGEKWFLPAIIRDKTLDDRLMYISVMINKLPLQSLIEKFGNNLSKFNTSTERFWTSL